MIFIPSYTSYSSTRSFLHFHIKKTAGYFLTDSILLAAKASISLAERSSFTSEALLVQIPLVSVRQSCAQLIEQLSSIKVPSSNNLPNKIFASVHDHYSDSLEHIIRSTLMTNKICTFTCIREPRARLFSEIAYNCRRQHIGNEADFWGYINSNQANLSNAMVKFFSSSDSFSAVTSSCNVQSAIQNLNKLDLVLNTSGLEINEALSHLLSALSLPCIALESRLNASSTHDIPVDVDRSRLNEWILANSEEDIALYHSIKTQPAATLSNSSMAGPCLVDEMRLHPYTVFIKSVNKSGSPIKTQSTLIKTDDYLQIENNSAL